MLLKIENELDDLLLPYTIDLSIFHKIENTDLIEHISRVGFVLYKRSKVKNAGSMGRGAGSLKREATEK